MNRLISFTSATPLGGSMPLTPRRVVVPYAEFLERRQRVPRMADVLPDEDAAHTIAAPPEPELPAPPVPAVSDGGK